MATQQRLTLSRFIRNRLFAHDRHLVSQMEMETVNRVIKQSSKIHEKLFNLDLCGKKC